MVKSGCSLGNSAVFTTFVYAAEPAACRALLGGSNEASQ